MDHSLDIQIKEEHFILACIAKEEWALETLYKEHYPTMLPVCLRYANNYEDALDILHDGFIKVFRHISKYKIGTSLGSWIRRIMINTSIDYYRKVKRKRTENLDTAYGQSIKGPDAVSDLSAEEILNALQSLTLAYRTVFNLYVIEGYSHREVGEKLGITESTSRSNLVKARTKLKNILLVNDFERYNER
ncbi:MAG: RNA polymerase sigma factor [Saprospiraceae bacterium]